MAAPACKLGTQSSNLHLLGRHDLVAGTLQRALGRVLLLQFLDEPGDGWRDLVHTIKGASRGIGANTLGDVADRAERGDASMAPEVRTALKDALADIEGYLTRIGGG